MLKIVRNTLVLAATVSLLAVNAGAADKPQDNPQTTKRKRLTYSFFAGAGLERGTEMATRADAEALAKKNAIDYLATLGGGRYHAKFLDYKVIRCDHMGGNPLYQRCIITFDYEVDDIP